ncbi:MAG: WYL domain-containing protein [Erysipelotrichaceae bacterium]|nr:WYL domain-containing protein [Erysipelotrichaceae bacterium]
MKNKQRLLEVLNYLRTNSNEDHSINTESIISHLDSRGIRAERKTIYSDVRELNEMGYTIESGREGYYFSGGALETAELRVLIDLIRASSFLSRKKSAEIMEKLLEMTNRYDRRLLESGDYENNKSANEQIYYNVSAIIGAIAQQRAITFKYFDYDASGQKRQRKHDYKVFPYDLIVDSDRYYLIGWQIKYSQPVNYRLDKMEKVELLDERYEKKQFDVAAYMNQTFRMFSGQKTNVTLKCRGNLYDELVKQFGSDMIITDMDEDSFTCNVNATVSPTFYAWVFTFDGAVTILSPEEVRNELKQMCERIISRH